MKRQVLCVGLLAASLAHAQAPTGEIAADQIGYPPGVAKAAAVPAGKAAGFTVQPVAARRLGRCEGPGMGNPNQHRSELSENDNVVVKARVMTLAEEQLAALAYLDDLCSYTSNEVAINWNAPLVYVSAALQALTPRPR